MNLAQAFRQSDTACFALVGAGGKTTALFHLARAFSHGTKLQPSRIENRPVIVSATTHLHVNQISLADKHWIVENPAGLAALEGPLQGVNLVTGHIEGDRTLGLDGRTMSRLYAVCCSRSLPLLIEADGSRQRPLKAPSAHEPAIPKFVETVVVVAGLSALGHPLNQDSVHRPEVFARLTGLSPGEVITGRALLRLLTHPEGGLKNIPDQARRLVLLNQADTPELQAQAKNLAGHLLADYHAVVIASLDRSLIHAVYEPVAGIVLAGGESRRFGRPKQLLHYHGQPFVRHVAQTALAGGLSTVVVVSGANAEAVEAAVSDLPVTLARNTEWQMGQSSSIQAGLYALASTPLLHRIEGQIPPSPSSFPFIGEGEKNGKMTFYTPFARRFQERKGERGESAQNGYERGTPSTPESHPERGWGVGAVIFLLADQPQVPPTLLRSLVERHGQTLSPIIAPLVAGQRANPVLFDRVTFPDLLALKGDVGGKAIFSKYSISYLDWQDESLLQDIDVPEDLEKLS